ncbi:MAG TPA: glycosyltransferase 87 family protein, partial [Chitinophagaceae bacterium]|nr:glycosyltransferase 87 family protein [Chitinophagaceae bacterium]
MFTHSFKLALFLCTMVLCWAIYRDIHLEKQYAGDLRNRVVGARMQKDGLSPYFYKWKNGDGLRYYDPDNFDSLQVANVTASPFFHALLYPVADLPQQSISRLWLVAEYAALLISLLLALLIARTSLQKTLVLLEGSLMLFTEAWKAHIGAGQSYLFIPLLMMIFVCCLRQRRIYFSLLAGLCAVALLLIRPTALFFFLPFLLLLNQYNNRWKILFFVPFVLVFAWLLTSSWQQYLWGQYKENITQQVLMHQQESPRLQQNAPNPGYANWEGISKEHIAEEEASFPIKIFSEN